MSRLGWLPTGSKDLLVSASPALGLQACPTMPGFMRGFQRPCTYHYACVSASTLLTKSSPPPPSGTLRSLFSMAHVFRILLLGLRSALHCVSHSTAAGLLAAAGITMSKGCGHRITLTTEIQMEASITTQSLGLILLYLCDLPFSPFLLELRYSHLQCLAIKGSVSLSVFFSAESSMCAECRVLGLRLDLLGQYVTCTSVLS